VLAVIQEVFAAIVSAAAIVVVSLLGELADPMPWKGVVSLLGELAVTQQKAPSDGV
jgi:hypothetical protein